jgi:DNA polymerase III subunit delta
MAIIRPGDIARFVASGCKTVPLVLVYGPDEGSVRTRVRAMVTALLGPEADSLNLLDLEADTVNADPARLLDEANAIAMFGGKRVILVSHAGKLQKSAWQPLLEVPPLDSTVIFQADDLAKTSPLRVTLEQSGSGAAIACYPPSRQDVQDLIDTQARSAGLSITPVARAYLADLLGADFALAEGEIEKLVLYCRDQIAIDVADIDAMITDSSDQAGSEPIDRAFEGKLEEIEAVALRSFREGINASGLLALALNHAMLLKRLALSKMNGSLDSAIRAERIFFRRQDRIRNQTARWDLSMLTKAIETLAAAQEQTRRTPALEETVAVRALWSVALGSRRR